MGKKTNYLYKIVTGLTVLLLWSLSVQYSEKTLAETNPITISTAPDSILFHIENMKPGDWTERAVTIQNRGAGNFTYNMEIVFKSGSKKLYNEFQLEVRDEKETIFYGKLEDLEGIPKRQLNAEHEEDLLFIIRFPSELGNDFQGLAFHTEFKFNAHQEEEVVNGGNQIQRPIDREGLRGGFKEGYILPVTATNSYNYLLIGIIVMLMGIFIYIYQNQKKRIIESK
ncbi:hypothetical protein [Halalkalibacter krulwichiae]|uniref:Uncharacterized protein n=1 Tax=Halalkalibacter krulwichiae TaxID=199441 RepID=A0A1X9MBG8_9BACI|nr:hypothetical protein [Halalkalibacter krulwichiae]ARK28921.1 hypothetical protein BkAM31D_03075 [Halalkalibacter krulwichiae]